MNSIDNNEENVNQPILKYKVTLKYPCKEQSDEPVTDYSLSLALPMQSLVMTEKLISDSEVFDASASESIRKWLEVFNEVNNKFMQGNSFDRSLNREEGDWQQTVESDNDEIKIVSANRAKGEGGVVSGDSALLLLNKALDTGTIVKVPLWHSGFWVTIKTPTTAMQIAIDRLLSNEKIVLGRQTNGMVFSSVSVYLRKILMDLILNSIISVSISNYNRDMLLKYIKVTDYNTLLWGLICTIYPNGYRLVQPCVNNIDECNYVAEEKVMLSKLSWTDNKILSKNQKEFMAKQKITKIAEKELLKYYDDNVWSSEKLVNINDSLSIVLDVPSIKEDIDTGIRWVDSVVDRVDEIFSEEKMDEETRNVRIIEQSRAGALRQYACWIKKLLIKNDKDETSTVVDRFTIDLSCETLTSNSDVCKKIFKEIGTYIDDVTVSIIGIPSYNCPKCQKPQTDERSLHPEIIPLAIDDIFFTLIRQNTNKIIKQEVTF